MRFHIYNAIGIETHADLLQLIGLGLVFVPVSVLPVGQAEGPHGHDAVNIVSDPGVRLIRAARQKTRHWILSNTERSK